MPPAIGPPARFELSGQPTDQLEVATALKLDNGLNEEAGMTTPRTDRRFRFTVAEELGIRDEYESGESITALARRHGCQPRTIASALTRAGVAEIRIGRPRLFTESEELQICGLYQSGLTQIEVASIWGCSQALISRVLSRHAIPPRTPDRPRGPRHGSWRGGRSKHPSGYWMIKNYDPEYRPMTNSQGYILEHRLIMAQHLGRLLTRDETVHHINGDPYDNRLENLQLRQGRHGRGVVTRCADCGSANVVCGPIAGPGPAPNPERPAAPAEPDRPPHV